MASVVCGIVEVCVFRFAGDRPEYLVLQRAAGDRLYPGIWQIVTGSIDERERAPDAALRELREETGLHPQRFWSAPHVSTYYDPARDAVNLTPLFAVQADPTAEPKLSSEHQRYEWLPHPLVLRRLVWPGQRQGLEIVHRYLLGDEEAGRLTLLSAS